MRRLVLARPARRGACWRVPRARDCGRWLAILATLAIAACAPPGGGPRPVVEQAAPVADSITVGLWPMDESGGALLKDAGPDRLDGTAGQDARTDFGRFGNARRFTSSIESWVYVPYAPALDSRNLTVEAWVWPEALGPYEDTPIAGRWNEYPGEQCWLFSLVGLRRSGRLSAVTSPGLHEHLVLAGSPGRLMFALQLSGADLPRVYFSTSEVPLARWTHVAASYDGQVVRLFLNGALDAQFAIAGSIRTGPAPLLIGNCFDTRQLSGFSGDLTTGGRIGHDPVYAFQGLIDALRISSQARTEFDVQP